MARTTTAQTGTLHWGQRQEVSGSQSAWYDTTVYRVPVSGTIDTWKIKQALVNTKYPPQHNYFGGYCSVGSVTEVQPGTVDVEIIYHIGH